MTGHFAWTSKVSHEVFITDCRKYPYFNKINPQQPIVIFRWNEKLLLTSRELTFYFKQAATRRPTRREGSSVHCCSKYSYANKPDIILP